MSIVPFIVSDEPNGTVVTEKSKFDQNEGKICILNLDDTQLSDPLDSNVSYGLRVGKNYRDHMKNETVSIDDGQKITLKPGQAIIIETEEWVHFSNNKFGQILPKVGLLHKGVSNTTSKVDPGYEGNLTISLFNLGKDTISLKRKEEFCTLIIQEVSPGTTPYQKAGKTIPNTNQKKPWYKQLLTLLKDYSWLLTLVISIVAILVAAFK